MKFIFRKMIKPLLLLLLVIFLASCNFSNDLPAINPLPVITDLPVKLTASFDIDSSTPNSLQNLVLQASKNKTEANRSATANMPSNIQYFVMAETLGEAVPLTVNVPDDDIDEANKRFTINLRTGHTWRITVGIIDTDINETILSDYTDKELTATNTDISHNFTLKPSITSGVNGSIYLEINFDDPDYTVDITDEANAYSDWNTNFFGSGSTITLNISSIPSGRYVLKIKFTKTNTIPFTATQVVTVYDNLKTDTWVSGGNALIDPTTNEFRLSNTIIAAANEGKKIYYVDGNTGGAGNDNNSGNINSPLLTVARAVSLINAVGNTSDTYKIYVKGGTSETVSTSIAIGGASANRKIELYTYLNSPTDGLGAVTLTRTSAINILTINNGSQLTINGGFTFDGAELEQAGINNSGTLTMNNGIVQKCYATGILNIGTFNFGKLEGNKDQYTFNSQYLNKTRADIEQLAKSSPRIMALLKEHNLPLRVNMGAFSGFEPTNGHYAVTRVLAAKIYSSLPAELKEQVNISNLQQAALLHDYGKVLIPPKILDKKGSLTPDERKIMELHSEFGYELLKQLGVDEEVLYLVKNHHQKPDGSGYSPADNDFEYNLSLEILTAADKYSALTEDRCYHKACTKEEALDIIYKDVEDGVISQEVFDALKKSL